MRVLYIFISTILVFLLFSCKQESFQKEEQNTAGYTKLARISDLVYLYESDSKKPFADPLYIDVAVNGVDGRSIHVQDASGLAIRVFTGNVQEFSPGDLVRISVGGEVLNVDNSHFILDNPTGVSIVGNSVSTPSPATLESLAEDIATFTSKVVNIGELTFEEKRQKDGITSYLIDQDVAPDSKIWVNIPDNLDYDMPMSVSSTRGFVVHENGDIYINVRTQDDIQEIYIEPTMMEKLLTNSALVKSLLQSNEIEVAAGVKMSEMSYINNDDLLTSCTVFEVDLNNPKVRLEPGSPNDSGPPFHTLQNLTTMAEYKNNHYGGTDWRVLAAITGDIHQAGTPNIVRGPLVKDGTVLKTEFWDPAHGFFGILKNGAGFLFGGKTEFDQAKDQLDHAVGGVILLRDGEPLDLPGNRDPRAAIGYTVGGKAFLFVGNGRYTSVSNGYTRNEIANFLKALGCEGGLYLMEGGASVGILENQNTGAYDVFSRTHATNANHNPPLASAWMIVTERDE